MSISPTRSEETKLAGHFDFIATGVGQQIIDSFELEIVLPSGFPNDLPVVRELGHKIPASGFHVNPDGTLCLGSYLRLKKLLFESPDLVSFAKSSLVPYLFCVSIKLRDGGNFILGELDHGVEGIRDDYAEMFGLKATSQVIRTLELLGLKRRIANKLSCPCGCGMRLGRCVLHIRLNSLRRVATRSWFRIHAGEVSTGRFT